MLSRYAGNVPAPKDVPRHVVPSPCIGVCTIDDDGLCAGCHRTGAEIAAWPLMNDDARLRMMEEILPQRADGREPA